MPLVWTRIYRRNNSFFHVELYLSLGTNLGDREANLHSAMELLDSRLGAEHEALSEIMNTPAWGFEAPDFLNAVVRYESSLPSEEILDICKDIEREMGREEVLEYDSVGHRVYHDRIIDIDILLYGDLRISTPNLTIPHPLMEQRPFIMQLLKEVLS